MAYCVLADVKAKCQRLPMTAAAVTPVSTPTKEQVEQFIDDCSEELDGILTTLGYVVPATGTKTLKLLRKICSDGAAAMAMDAAYTGSSPNASEQSEKYQKRYDKALDRFSSGKMTLPDAPYNTNAQGQPRGSGFASSFETEEGNEPYVTRDQEF